MKKTGSLYLLPSFLGEDAELNYLCGYEILLIQELRCYFTENEKSARRFLRKSGYKESLDEIDLHLLNKDTEIKEQIRLLNILLHGTDAGMISEAGSPAIADPGTSFIRLAHQHHIPVIPVPGPSAIMLAIMASGLNGQQFSFNGYLPIDKNERSKKIISLEELSYKTGYAQFFIETPYRNEALLSDLLTRCHPDTDICLAVNLSQNGSWIETHSIAEWRKKSPQIHKIPVVFGMMRRKNQY